MFMREAGSFQISTVSMANDALLRAAESASIITESPEPLWPPNGTSAPPSSAAAGSVVGAPVESTAQPAGIEVPSFRAETTLP